MPAIIVVALLITSPGSVTEPASAERHVRATSTRISSLIETGLSRSATFRQLVTILNASDVIVYVASKQMRPALGGYLAHDIVAVAGMRYLHIFVETQGSRRRLVSLLAHELQHAVEVAQAPEVRDPMSLEQLFSRLAVPGCGSTSCYETQAAKDVEYTVNEELAPRR